MEKRVRGFACLFLWMQGCWYSQDDQGKATVLGPELVPIAVGVAVYKEAQEVDLNLEFVISRSCTRVTPLDSFRFSLKKLDGKPEILLEQFVSTRTKQIQHPRLERGRYEITVHHQDRKGKVVKKTFSIYEKSPLVLVDVPCLDE